MAWDNVNGLELSHQGALIPTPMTTSIATTSLPNYEENPKQHDFDVGLYFLYADFHTPNGRTTPIDVM